MEFTARLIADLVGGTIEGDPNVKVTKFARIENGDIGSLSFLANPKYTNHIYDSSSSVIIVSNNFTPEKPVSATLIRVEDPYAAISLLMEKANNMINPQPVGIENPSFIAEDVIIPEDAYIGAFAYIGKGAKIGKGVKVYPQTYIGNDVTIGDNTIVYPGAKIYHSVIIGKNCIIHAGAVIGADGFGFAPLPDGSYRKIPQIGTVKIADNVEIGANTTIDRATLHTTKIGHGTKIDNLVQIAHNVSVGDNTVMSSQVGVAGSSRIGDNCVLAGQVGIAGHISIGDRVTIGAQSGVPNSVKSDQKIMGYPAIPGLGFARQAGYLRRLPDLFKRLEDLEKKSK